MNRTLEDSEYFGVGGSKGDFHLEEAVEVYFGGDEELLLQLVYGERTDWKSIDGEVLEAWHVETITLTDFPNDIEPVVCDGCGEQIYP